MPHSLHPRRSVLGTQQLSTTPTSYRNCRRCHLASGKRRHVRRADEATAGRLRGSSVGPSSAYSSRPMSYNTCVQEYMRRRAVDYRRHPIPCANTVQVAHPPPLRYVGVGSMKSGGHPMRTALRRPCSNYVGIAVDTCVDTSVCACSVTISALSSIQKQTQSDASDTYTLNDKRISTASCFLRCSCKKLPA